MSEPDPKNILLNIVIPQLARITGIRNLRFRAVPMGTADTVLPYQFMFDFKKRFRSFFHLGKLSRKTWHYFETFLTVCDS